MRRFQKRRGFAEELDREIDLAGNLRLRVLRRHSKPHTCARYREGHSETETDQTPNTEQSQ